MEISLYTEIDSQETLDKLKNTVCWADSRLCDIFVSSNGLNSFPRNLPNELEDPLNYYCLFEVCSVPCSHLVVIFVHSKITKKYRIETSKIFDHFPFYSDISEKKEFNYSAFHNDLKFYSERVIYRFLDLEDSDAADYFSAPHFFNYRNHKLTAEGYSLIENSNNENILVTPQDEHTELSISSKDGTPISIQLDCNEVNELMKALKVFSKQ